MSSQEPAVESLFTLDAETADDVFPGWHHRDTHWNGFAMPSFDRATTERILTRLAEQDSTLAYTWEANVLIVSRTTDHIDENPLEDRIEPDADGRYPLGAGTWTWFEIVVPAEETLGTWLERQREAAMVADEVRNRVIAWLTRLQAPQAVPALSIALTAADLGETVLADLRPSTTALLPEPTRRLITHYARESADVNATWAGLTDEQRCVVLAEAITRALP